MAAITVGDNKHHVFCISVEYFSAEQSGPRLYLCHSKLFILITIEKKNLLVCFEFSCFLHNPRALGLKVILPQYFLCCCHSCAQPLLLFTSQGLCHSLPTLVLGSLNLLIITKDRNSVKSTWLVEQNTLMIQLSSSPSHILFKQASQAQQQQDTTPHEHLLGSPQPFVLIQQLLEVGL